VSPDQNDPSAGGWATRLVRVSGHRRGAPRVLDVCLITADEIIACRPCWLNEPDGEARIRALVGDGITPARPRATRRRVAR
jgi:hypothetical protein